MSIKSVRRPVAILLVIVMLISMSVFILGATNMPAATAHEGIVRASTLAPPVDEYTDERQTEENQDAPSSPPGSGSLDAPPSGGDSDPPPPGEDASDSSSDSDAGDWSSGEDITNPPPGEDRVDPSTGNITSPPTDAGAEASMDSNDESTASENEETTAPEGSDESGNSLSDEQPGAFLGEIYFTDEQSPAEENTGDNLAVLGVSTTVASDESAASAETNDVNTAALNELDLSDLTNFVSYAYVTDLMDDPLDSDMEDAFNQTYRFNIFFNENGADLQFEYDSQTGKLFYQLPAGLSIGVPIAETPIRTDAGLAIGLYSVDMNGLVQIWFDDVDIDGEALDLNFIAYYSDILIHLTIDALLLEESNGELDFGNGWVLSIPPVSYGAAFSPLQAVNPLDQSQLANFLVRTTITQLDPPPPVVIYDTDDPPLSPPQVYIGQTYLFSFDFVEGGTDSTQFEMGRDGRMTFMLPDMLNITAPIPATPIRHDVTNAIIGSYTISTAGLVSVTFDYVDSDGNPTPDGTSYNDFYRNASLNLQIYALMTAGDGSGGLDFGNGDIIVVVPTNPPARIEVVKTSQYVQATERINYTVTIRAVTGPVSNISFADAPTIGGSPIQNPAANDAFSLFTYQVFSSGSFDRMQPMPVSRITSPSALFSYNFGGLTLETGDSITIRFSLDIQKLIANNPGLLPSGNNSLNYNFIIGNNAAAHGSGPNGEDLDGSSNTSDLVDKRFTINKSGTANSNGEDNPDGSGFTWIDWTVTVGDGVSVNLNGGTITETLQSSLMLPPNSAIQFRFFGQNGVVSLTTTADQLPGYYTRVSNNVFTLLVPETGFINPGTGTAIGGILKVVITFSTNVTSGFPSPGQPPINFNNDVWFEFPDGSGYGDTVIVPVRPPTTASITKTSSGICGTPGGAHWIDYNTVIRIPAGLDGDFLQVYDNLGLYLNGRGVANVPTNLVVTAAETATNNPLPLDYVLTEYTANSWRLYLGSTNLNSAMWPYFMPVTLTISYRIDLSDADIATMRSDPAIRLQNAVYLINTISNPNATIDISNTGNSVGGHSINDYWPISKAGTPTANPSLFDYVVTLNGFNSSNRPAGNLMKPGSNPSFTDDYDDRMEYIPNSFYIVDTGSPARYFAPAPGTDVGAGPDSSSFSVTLRNLVEFSGPPNAATTTLIGVPSDEWFTSRNKFEARYQLRVIATGTEIQDLTNTASINVNPGECTFENSGIVDYVPIILQKGLTPSSPGSDVVHVEIVVNGDGSQDFHDPTLSPPGPDLITAYDELTNLKLYTDSVRLYTQTWDADLGIWDGIWIEMPLSMNNGAEWSVNYISDTVFSFVIPNRTPVKIAYDALVLIPEGGSGNIGNKISIYGENDDFEDGNYNVSDSQVGAGGNFLPIRVFKQDGAGNSLPDVRFDLYVAMVSDTSPYQYTSPSSQLTSTLAVQCTDGVFRTFYRLLSGVTSDSVGVALFENQFIVADYNYIFLLHEVEAPAPYFTPAGLDAYTFFAVNPAVNRTLHGGLLGKPVNQISDFITVDNELSAEMELFKRFTYSDSAYFGISPNPGLPPDRPSGLLPGTITFLLYGPVPAGGGSAPRREIALNLSNNTNFTVIDNEVAYSIDIPDLQAGTYTIYERGGFMFGYTMQSFTPAGQVLTLLPGQTDAQFTFYNNYYPPIGFVPPAGLTPTIWLAKTFHGLTDSELSQITPNFALVITSDNPAFGNNGVMRISLTDLSNGGTLQSGGYAIENLPPGIYTITEDGYDLDGFALVSDPPIPYVFEVRQGSNYIYDANGNSTNSALLQVLFDNSYSVQPREITIRKVLNGLPPDRLPSDFAIIVTNITTVPYFDIARISGTAAINGVTLTNLPSGTYRITEVGHTNIPGFTWVGSNPALPLEITLNNQNPTIELEITNTYRFTPGIVIPPVNGGDIPPIPITPIVPPTDPPPTDPPHPPDPSDPSDPNDPTDSTDGSTNGGDPPTPPDQVSPITGDSLQLGVYIALIILGVSLTAFGIIKSRKTRK